MKTFKNICDETLDIGYVALSSKVLPSLFKLWPCPGGHVFRRLIFGKHKKNPKHRALIFGM